MAFKPADERISNYTNNLDPTKVAAILTAKKTSMVAKETAMINAMVDLDDRARGVLAGATAISVDYPKYYAFVHQVFSLQRRLPGGNALVCEVALCQAKWRARGCSDDVLSSLRDELFAIPAPTPPGP